MASGTGKAGSTLLHVAAGIALLLVVTFVGYRRTFTGVRLPVVGSLVFLTGIEYILVGFALGERLIGILDEETIRSLSPLFSLGLGVIGLILGIQFEAVKLARVPRRFFRATVVQAFVTMAVVAVPAYFFLGWWHGAGSGRVLPELLLLAATAACTSQTSLALLGRGLGLTRHPVMELLNYIASLDVLVTVTALGCVFCLLQTSPAFGPEALIGLQWFVVSLCLGVAMGLLLHLLTRLQCSDEELFLFVIGTVLFSAGAASYLRLSPLFVNMTLGLMATNLPGSKIRVLNLVLRLEKPFYVIFLVLAGAVWHPGSSLAFPLAGAYVAVRLLGKIAGGWLAGRLFVPPHRPPPGLGLGLAPQGGVVIAMIMSYYWLSPSRDTATLVTAVLLAVVVSELIGPRLVRGLLSRSAEGEP